MPDTSPVSTPPQPESFWQGFFRVETDRFILVAIIFLLHRWHASDTLLGTAVGGLIMSIQQQRFRWSK